MRNIIIAFMAVMVISLLRTLADYPPLPKVEATKPVARDISVPSKTEPVEPPVELSNEAKTWNFLTAQGYSRNQTAGIMGNLQQEHNFNTTDVPGGLGIAQWMGGRRSNLLARANSADLNVQLQFMMDELAGPESVAGKAVKAAETVESATISFQNLYERCGRCNEPQRINYAYGILGRY